VRFFAIGSFTLKIAIEDHWFHANQIKIIHVGAEYNNEMDLVVNAPKCLPYQTAFYGIWEVDPTKPRQCEADIKGKWYAKLKAQDRLVKSALNADAEDNTSLTVFYDNTLMEKGLSSRKDLHLFTKAYEVSLSHI